MIHTCIVVEMENSETTRLLVSLPPFPTLLNALCNTLAVHSKEQRTKLEHLHSIDEENCTKPKTIALAKNFSHKQDIRKEHRDMQLIWTLFIERKVWV